MSFPPPRLHWSGLQAPPEQCQPAPPSGTRMGLPCGPWGSRLLQALPLPFSNRPPPRWPSPWASQVRRSGGALEGTLTSRRESPSPGARGCMGAGSAHGGFSHTFCGCTPSPLPGSGLLRGRAGSQKCHMGWGGAQGMGQSGPHQALLQTKWVFLFLINSVQLLTSVRLFVTP